MLGMIVNGIGHADSGYGHGYGYGYGYAYGYGHYRSMERKRRTGEESHSLPLLATLAQPKPHTNGYGKSVRPEDSLT